MSEPKSFRSETRTQKSGKSITSGAAKRRKKKEVASAAISNTIKLTKYFQKRDLTVSALSIGYVSNNINEENNETHLDTQHVKEIIATETSDCTDEYMVSLT